MFIALYRWRIDPELEKQFQDAWSAVTLHYRENYGSSGSRLHRGSDGLFYAYAIWPDNDARQSAFATQDEATIAHRELMNSAIVEHCPEIVLETIADHII